MKTVLLVLTALVSLSSCNPNQRRMTVGAVSDERTSSPPRHPAPGADDPTRANHAPAQGD